MPKTTTPSTELVRRVALAATVTAATLTLASLIPASLPAQQRADESGSPPLVVSTQWLAKQVDNPNVVVLHIEHGDYAEGHIAGARPLPYRQLVVSRDDLGSELPTRDSLRALLESLGVSDSSQVVVYAHEAPMATRALLSLAAIGHTRYSLLDGGLVGWRASAQPISRNTPTWTRGRLTAHTNGDVIVTAPWIREHMGRGGLALIDTRTDGEYNGTGNRSGMPSAGHLAGSQQLEWQDLFADRLVTLKPEAELRALFAARVRQGDTVVTYCWVGYRASTTWFLARLLGYDAKLYDGSYQDWMQRSLPTVPGTKPDNASNDFN